MNFDKKQLRNTLLLLLGALIWGTAFVAQSVGSGYVGPYTFLAARSWLACAFLIVLVLLRRGKARKADPGVPFWINGRMLLRGGVFCGIALFAASAAQQIGIGTTSTAKAGFLTALYVVLVPLLGVFFGRRPGVKLGICACISLAGLYLLCLAGHDTLTLTGGTVVIDGANVYDTHPDVNASLVVNTSGTMTIKGGATLNHPTTKAVNVKGGKVLVENATIFSDKYAIYAAKGTAEVNKANVTVNGTGTMTEDGGTIIRK